VSAVGEGRERRPTALVVLALALTIAALHSRTLFGGGVYHADDVGAGYWPSHVAILRALADGELPVWEPRAWGGYPLVAVPYYGTFYPPNALFWLLGTTRAVAWLVAAHQLAGGTAMLSLLRRRGRTLPAASFGAFAYALGTFSVERIRHLPFQQMVAWIPLLLLGIGEIVDTRARRGVPLVALSLGAMCLAGAEPLLPFVLALALAYSLPRALGAGSLRVWGGLVAGPLLGAGIGAAQLLPTLWHLPLSPRALGTSYEFASSYAWPDLRWLVTLVAPDLFGVPHAGRWFGPYNHWELAGYYVGALAVALAFAAPVARKRELAALAVLSLAAVGIALGDAGPIHPILFRYAPVYASLRCPARALVILTVTVPILAAEGIDRLRGLAPSDRALRGWFAALVVCTLALLVAGGLSPHGGPAEAQRDATHHLILQIVAFCACGALLAAGMAHDKVAWAATAFLALDVSTIGRGYLEPVDAQSVTALSREPAVERMLAVVGDDRAAFGRDLGVGAQNLGLVDDFREVAGYDSFPVWRWVHLLWIASTGHPYPHRELRQDLAALVPRFESPLVDVLDVRWLVSTEVPGSPWIERPVGDVASRDAVRLFENTEAMPPAFLMHRVRVEPSAEQQAQAVARIDPRREVVLDAPPSPSPRGGDDAPIPARVVARTRTRLQIETDDPDDSVLVVSETMYPGWKARVDGRLAEVHYADYALRGVAVASGKHHVEMWFEPPWGHTGEIVTFVSVALAGAFAALSRAKRFRPEPRRNKE
jgi:Bacterial membrane protein YfhO